jgi:hypothetical protein
MIDLTWYAILITIVVSALAGWIFAGRIINRKGDMSELRAIPYAGPLLDYKSWKPSNKNDWNIILNKALMIGYVLLAVWIPFMWIFVAIALVYDFDWTER